MSLFFIHNFFLFELKKNSSLYIYIYIYINVNQISIEKD
jgi:hypothetical protein